MAEAKVDIGKVRKLLELAKDLQDKQADVIAEIDAILGGGAGIGAKMKQLEGAFDSAWCSRYAAGQHGRYVWAYVKDRPQMKRLLKAIDLEDLEARVLRYVRSEDPFYVRARHPFDLFVRSVNQWAAPANAPEEDLELEGSAPIDCKHTPRCRTEAAHTAKRAADMRVTS